MTKADVGSMVRNRRTGQTGSAFVGFRDAHVHLGLIDRAELAAGGLCGVVDLGWTADIATLAADTPVHVAYAGRFLAAPEGYPTDRSWAPEGCVQPVASADQAAEAVATQVVLGATVIKVTLHPDAGPTLAPQTLTTIVAAAATRGLPVVAHAEGRGTVETSLDAGVQVLAHTPWTDRLPDAVIARAARSQRWVSTLAIHGRGTPELETAMDNLRRFHQVGGEVLYGTDLGNGDLPVGINHRELELLHHAGLRNRELVHALTAPFPTHLPEDLVTFIPGLPDHDVAGWLAQATVVRPDELRPLE